ncbi:oxidoreductase [Xanthomonas fragariae]|uniref:Oxidoreductase n=1 Tax=Xanthomonas fragariae TaxID=48664 RepID=A0A1Y6H719_9XANT|nr:SDR family oxidoreductase [Xanthomonas fragariae]SMQ97632.1 Bacilysin biosynthesis oxidoreductase YwfH [Xanthomonas fragariae]SMR04905.1 oxidoreductase [Xanthomonas fragariae]
MACAASKGWGLGCTRAVASEGVKVVIVARGRDVLEQADDALHALPGAGEVRSAVADIVTPQGRTDALAACPQVDIPINNTGGPPPGDFRQWERENWLRALDANMLAPIELIRVSLDAMRAQRFGCIVNITSRCGEGADRHPRPVQWRARRPHRLRCRAGTQRSRRQCHDQPGQFATDRLRGNFAAIAQQQSSTAQDVAERKRAGIPARRFGEPDEFGAACVFLCSAQAAYITG